MYRNNPNKKERFTRQHRLFSLLLLLLVSWSCNQDEDFLNREPPVEEVVGYPGVDEELWPWFELFESEAAERGVSINLVQMGITGVIEEIEEDNIAGRCNFNRGIPNHVMVDESFWQNTSNLGRQFIVFHELGHCSLFRDHREDADQFGICLSIMRSGLGDCRDNFSPRNRSEYLNELFDPAFEGEIFRNQ